MTGGRFIRPPMPKSASLPPCGHGALCQRPARHAPQAALACDPRLAPGGRIAVNLAPRPDDGEGWRGEATLTAAGAARPSDPRMAALGRAAGPWCAAGAIRSTRRCASGPTCRQCVQPDLQTFLRNAQLGLIARRIRGEGTQFEALSEYEPGMDRRRIDWKASARHTRLFARENESERNNQIVFAFDCGQAMCEPVDGLPRIDRAVSAALTCAYVALKGGDRCALFGFAQGPADHDPLHR
jgi:hypothetical protein